jgi:CheY-like chemotaxis protein
MGAPTRILVVDDNEDAADMLAAVLELRGYEIRVAHDPKQAIAVAKEFVPEVAFLDLGLPEMDGCQLAIEMRALPGLEQVRLIALTGYGQAADRERTKEAGFADHLVKPVELRTLEATLATS